ncbi:MAG TPA: SDR family NAD(P)-dependent oxidoreductase [Mycobacterium sp.]|nr:SDR family NAD(P)-dependent oxidoreductase [Mycobacterium sp.]
MSHSRAVVITEASSPIALATAARLAADGDLVLMGSRRTEICERFAARLRSDGAAAFAAYLDLADPPSIDPFVESADYLIGSVDVLVSTAGVADGSWVGAQHFAEQFIPPMIERGRGDVVLIGPSAGRSRRRLEAWVAGLDAEFVGTGVRASIIRSTESMPPDDVGYLVAAAIGARLRVVDVIAPAPAASRSTPAH